jgi:tRNA dimethylallyltransferase
MTREVQALCLAGPTASGKSALALAFAAQQAKRVEIISVDSAQVYRGLDIGTAKPSVAERAAVPHHLIDILEPEQSYSAAQFAADARRLVAEARARGHLPLLVGGTMLYFKALREGLDALPESDPAVRSALDAEALERGWPALHAELAHVDPASAARLAPHDAQRIQRALEVWRTSGRTLSSWQRGPRAADATSFPLVTLEPADRGWLHERIALRFNAMLSEGLLDEVRRLRARPGLHAALPSMRAVGYRQAWQALDVDGAAFDLGALRERGVAATRQLAKRQLTWLRSISARAVIECDTPAALPRGIAALERAAGGG